MDIIDLVNPVLLDEVKWIGQGRTYPTSNPSQELIVYRDSHLEIPKDWAELLLPKDNLTVRELLATLLVKGTHALIFKAPENSYHRLAPNQDALCLKMRTLPPQSFVDAALEGVGQALLDGMKSVEDPRYPGARLPLWVLQFWKEMYRMLVVHAGWRKGYDWITANIEERSDAVGGAGSTEELKAFEQARTYLLSLRWNEQTTIPGAASQTTTFSFAGLLASHWVTSTHIDMMIQNLTERMESSEALDTLIIIENLRFMNDIEKAKAIDDHNKPLTTFLKRLEHRIKSNNSEMLLFPVHMEKMKHWVAIQVDFKARTISYGDSLAHEGMPRPKAAIKKLRWWLQKRFESPFRELGDQLVHGKQEDGTECGILTVNTIAHKVFQDPLWVVGRKAVERVIWFNKLVGTHIQEIDSNPAMASYTTAEPSARTTSALSLTFILNPENVVINPLTTTLPGQPMSMVEMTQLREELNCAMDVDNDATPFENLEVAEPGEADEDGGNLPQILYAMFTKEGSGASEPQVTKRVIDEVEGESKMDPTKVRKTTESGLGDFRAVQGKSRSATWERSQNEKYLEGTSSGFNAEDKGKLDKFTTSINLCDSRAVIFDSKTVRHFKCGKKLTMKTPYSTQAFKFHIKNCTGPPKSSNLAGGGMNLIGTYFTSHTVNPTHQTQNPRPTLPCPGLDQVEYPNIQKYLGRTGALGGGASSVTVISQELFGKAFKNLSKPHKVQVQTAQKQDWIWKNDANAGKVFSLVCLKQSGSSANAEGPCAKCLELLEHKGFKNAIHIACPADKNFKYLNQQYRNKSLAEIYGRTKGLREILEDDKLGKSPMVKYVQGVISGQHKGNDLFGSLLQAMVLKSEKDNRGVGMQNFQYAPNLVECAHIVFTHSPRAYAFLQEHLALPDPRTLKFHRARLPRFPMGISEKTFQLARDHLKQIDYDGPVALSCDDTKLLASFRPYFDKELDGYYVMGHVGEPLRLLDPSSFTDITGNNDLEKASKLRLWCLQVPIPNVPPIILAVLGISNKQKAADLFKYLWNIVNGLIDHGIQIASYAADGSSVERSIQSMLEAKATSRLAITIKHPADGCDNIKFTIPFFRKQPIACVQDSKHLLKTFRNNLYSGARLLTFPDGVAHYGQVRSIAFSSDSPLFRRDVVKVDRQDDNAATRLFSASVLEWLKKHNPDHLALIVYLFVFGELIDAYQNRFISIITRIRMVLRARFFLDIWVQFLKTAGYPKEKHFVSHQCADITRILIEGFLKLVIIYRDHVGRRRPFLPWLLSTEVVEHVFGICRQIIKDFTMLDFYLMVPKLFIKLREAIFSSKISAGKATAMGYNHTYADTRGIDLVVLADYPSDQDIDEASGNAYEEANSLFALLGLSAEELPTDSSPSSAIRPIDSWFQETLAELQDEAEGDEYAELACEVEKESQIEDLQSAMDAAEGFEPLTKQEEQRLMDLRYAGIALTIDEQINICSLPEYTEEEQVDALSEDAATIAQFLADSLPAPTSDLDKPTLPYLDLNLSGVDITNLINLRWAHQTKQAASGIRTTTKISLATLTAQSGLSERQAVLRGFRDAIKQREEVGAGTGVERSARWRQPAPGGRDGEVDGEVAAPAAAGNSANAVVSATAAAKRLLTQRKAAVKKFKLPVELEAGRISELTPLQIADSKTPSGWAYGFASVGKKVVLVKVLSIYTKNAGKGTTHAWASDTSVITAISNLPVQIFEHMHGRHFRAKAQGKALHISTFDVLSSSQLLCTLTHSPAMTNDGGMMAIVQEDHEVFKTLNSRREAIKGAAIALGGKKKKATEIETDDED